MNRRRALLLSITVVLTLCAACGWWLHQERQQYAINRALIAALQRGDTTQALHLVKVGADPNTRYFPNPAPSFKLLLHQLLHHWSPVNDSPTAFITACAAHSAFSAGRRVFPSALDEDPELVQTMLAHGANINARAWNYETALHSAVADERPRTVELLLKHGADVNAQTRWGETALMLTPSHEDMSIARLLLAYYADPNVQDVNGDTVLYWGIESPNAPILFRELLAHGADPNVRDNYGSTPLIMAKTTFHPELVRLLMHGAK